MGPSPHSTSMEVGLSPNDIVLDGTQPPLPQREGGAAQFSDHVYCDQMARWIKMPLGRMVGLSPRDIVLDVDQLHPLQRGRSTPIFGPCLLWPRRLGGSRCQWIKMPLGMELGLGPGHIVPNGDPAPPPPKGHSPQLRLCPLWPNGWMDQDATW